MVDGNVCVVSAVNDGSCSPWVMCSCSVVQEMWWVATRFMTGVKFPYSVMIWAAMSSAGAGPLYFLKTNVTASIFQYILEHFMLPSADQLFKDADFIFQQDLAPAHTAKSTKSWLNDHGVGVLDWPANSPDLNPIENIWGIVKRKMRNKRPKNADELKATVKETWASIPPQQCHKLITSIPRRSIEYIYSKLTYFPEELQFTKKMFLLVLWSILICWDLVGFC